MVGSMPGAEPRPPEPEASGPEAAELEPGSRFDLPIHVSPEEAGIPIHSCPNCGCDELTIAPYTYGLGLPGRAIYCARCTWYGVLEAPIVPGWGPA